MYSACMSVALQIRDVPESVRDTLADAAKRRGQSLQAYLLAVVEREAEVTSRIDLAWPRHRVEIPDDLAPEHLIREGRQAGAEADRADL